MEYRRLGGSGLRVSEVSLGSWLTLGSSVDREATRKIVEHAYDLGINFFDTADIYAKGEAEETLGAALRGIPRPYIVLATKCFFPLSNDPNDKGLSRKHIFESVEQSLRRLGTDYLDLHQCHRPDPETPIEETVCAYEDLVRQGKLLYWGVSEWTSEDIVTACRIADARNAYRPVSNQPQYNIFRRGIERKHLRVCEDAGVGQIVFSPLAQGVLTGKYSGGTIPSGTRAGDEERNRFMGDFLKPQCVAQVDQLKPLADELGINLAQLALAWCLRHPNVSSVIVGATRPEQIEDNAAAAGFRLPEEIVQRIDALTSEAR
ncbi:MAG: aldo/keto reductase family protein [Myxococcota bacterium]|nr:aldo/keto reductase family protein [Myxococcota bacterium]